MKCIDPWLLNNRRQCPVCKRYVFPNQDNSDEEESNSHTATERTPLIRPSDDDSVTAISRNRQIGKYIEYYYVQSDELNLNTFFVNYSLSIIECFLRFRDV
jgi:hypothetical protein